MTGLWIGDILSPFNIEPAKSPLESLIYMMSDLGNFSLLWPLHAFVILLQIVVRLLIKERALFWYAAIALGFCVMWQVLMSQLAQGNI